LRDLAPQILLTIAASFGLGAALDRSGVSAMLGAILAEVEPLLGPLP